MLCEREGIMAVRRTCQVCSVQWTDGTFVQQTDRGKMEKQRGYLRWLDGH